ncbi:MAG: PleD family two-component system response regulator [Dehalococcoidales bacterium]
MKTNIGARQLLILVVEDDREISRLIRHNLENKSTEVIEAATGLDGIRVLREMRVDLVLLDLKLPDFNGWGILSLLRLTEPLRNIPVVVTSIEPPNTALVERLKPNDYIQKPFDMRDLLTRVRKVINSGVLTNDSLTSLKDGGAYESH